MGAPRTGAPGSEAGGALVVVDSALGAARNGFLDGCIETGDDVKMFGP